MRQTECLRTTKKKNPEVLTTRSLRSLVPKGIIKDTEQRVVKKTEPKCASKDRLGELLYNKKDKKRNSIQFNG